MSEINLDNIRTTVSPSSLGSYFGVGFNTPEEQFLIDTGEVINEFDEDAILRMELGNILEDSATDFFEKMIFKTPITDRNTEVKTDSEGKIRYKLDGKMMWRGKPAIYENKISNSAGVKFTENLGYHIQLQTYMMLEGCEYGILAGLYQGKPIYKVFEKDEALQADIKIMIDFIHSALNGLVDFYDDFPVDILAKYGKEVIYEPITNLSAITVEYLHKLAELNDAKKKIEKEIKELEFLHSGDVGIEAGTYQDDKIILTVSDVKRNGSFDVDAFRAAHPFLDLSPYYKPDSYYKMRKIKLKETN